MVFKRNSNMKLFFPLSIFIFILSYPTGSTAQTRQIKFNHLVGANGIPLGKINAITRDIHGVMWFSDQTNRCIIRYDGNRMTRYQNDPKNPNSLGGSYPECLFADSSGIIWIGFYGMGLDRFDPETNNFTHFRHQVTNQTSLGNDSVTAILIDHAGNFWVGNYGGLDRFDIKTGKFKHYSNNVHDSLSLSSNKVRAVYEDHEGTLWIGTGLVWDINNEGGLNRFNRNNETFTRYLSNPKNPQSLINNKVRAIFEDSKGTFWVGTAGDGLHSLDRKTGLFERHTYDPAKPMQLSRPAIKSADDHITFITEDAGGSLWTGTFTNGINRYDPSTKTITHFGNDADKSGAFKDNNGWCAISSPDGLFWLSTQSANLYKVDLYTNKIPHYESGNIGINSFYEETPSLFWMATDSGLIRNDLINGTSHRFVNEPLNGNSLSSSIVSNIYKDKQGDFWIGTGEGLNRYNPNTRIFTRFKHDANNVTSLSGDNISTIYEDHELNFWVGTFGGGLNLMNRKTGEFTHFRHDPSDSNSISQDLVTFIGEDQMNDLWIGTISNGGINKLNRKTGKFKHYLTNISVGNIFIDGEGIMWVGASDGLYRYDRKLDEFYAFDAGLNITEVKSMTGDNDNNIWMGSSSGILRLNKKRDQLILYGKENEVNGENLYYGSAFKTQKGELFFGDRYGYYAFHPDKLTINTNAPKIYFTNFWINGQVVRPGNGSALSEPLYKAAGIHLAHDENIFSFSFTSIDYGNPEAKLFFYKLENYDKDWRQPGTEDRVYYFNVPPGKYIFKIKAANRGNGIWAEKDIAIIITPPWYGTWWAYCLYGFLLVVIAYSLHRFQRARLIKAERERTRERELAQAKEIEKAYRELKTTQTQLIQSEKMASLGELTAGIAHEIQNPLNFVNNFSEVNTELIAEMKEEIDKGNLEEVKAIANDIAANEQKINHHGRRADSIVKGMLQHSRSSNGIKEPTNINMLADEYLRLAYHGLRAKDKSFNATMKTDFDQSIGDINIIPQDIGRVILNLITNAFYAVTEKKMQMGESYEPTVTVSTALAPVSAGGGVEVRVKDNGNGISPKVLEKIFQPFFTTKPTGQGTGLGLSMSYDIVTKGHDGQLTVKTIEGDGTEFIINLPI